MTETTFLDSTGADGDAASVSDIYQIHSLTWSARLRQHVIDDEQTHASRSAGGTSLRLQQNKLKQDLGRLCPGS